MRLSQPLRPSAPRSHCCSRLFISSSLGRQQSRLCLSRRVARACNGCESSVPSVNRPSHSRWQPPAAAAAAAAASSPPAAQHVEYQVSGCTFSVSLRGGGSNGTAQQQLLRLQEASADSEYVLVLPASMSGVLLEVLERAVQCVSTGNEGRPLELHHTVQQGVRSFRCSLVYSPGPQQLVNVTVQEVGRSCVHLPVSPDVLQQVSRLLELLQAVAGPQQPPPQQQLPPAAAGGWGSASLGAAPPAAAAAAAAEAVDRRTTAAVTSSGGNGVHAASAAETDQASSATGQQLDTSVAAGADEPLLTADNTESADSAAAAEAEAASAVTEGSPAADSNHTAAAAAATAAAAAAAAAPAAPSPSPTAPEVLLAAISSSTAVQDGFKFAHAAAAEASAGPGQTGGSAAAGRQVLFQLPHLCCLWQKLPVYAASMQRGLMQPGVPGSGLEDVTDEELLDSTQLLPEVQQELQALLRVLVPLLQPHLTDCPRQTLQHLLQAAVDAQLYLPGTFLEAWAAAATAPTARGSWVLEEASSAADSGASGDSSSTCALLGVSLLLQAVVGQQQQQHQPEQGPPALPLRWCVHALSEAGMILQQVMPAACDSLLQQGASSSLDDLRELLPVLLAACGHHLQQQQLLWRHWGGEAGDSSSGSSEGSCAELLSLLDTSLEQLFGADFSQQEGSTKGALLPGLQQEQVLGWVMQLLQQQQAAAVALLWSWLGYGGGAQQLDSSLLRQLLEGLPYDAAAASHAAAAADVNSTSSGSSLLQHVLVMHTNSSSSSSSQELRGDAAVQQVESLSGMLAYALQADARAAFVALPSILQALPDSTQLSSSNSSSSSSQRWDQAVAELCGQLQQMLQLGPQQLLSHSLTVLQAAAQLSTAAGVATGKCVLTVLQLAQQLAGAAGSWHAAAAAPVLQQAGSAGGAADAAGDLQQVPTAAELVSCCRGFAPAWAQVCSSPVEEQLQQSLLPTLSELLRIAAALEEDHGNHTSLAPSWLSQAVEGTSSSSCCCWAGFEPVLLAAAAGSNKTAMVAEDTAAAASALLVLGVPPSQLLLQAYWAAVGPEALGFSAVGLQQLLWITAGITQQQQGPGGASSSSSSDGAQLLRLASKACSSLAVRSSSALSARQAAKVTWALAQLASSDAATAAAAGGGGGGGGWSPPQQALAWLRRVWQGMDGSTGAASSSRGSWVGAGQVGREVKVSQLQQHGVLQQQEAAELLSAMQELELLPGKQQRKHSHEEQQQQQQHQEQQERHQDFQPEPSQQQQQGPQAAAAEEQQQEKQRPAVLGQDREQPSQPLHPLLQQKQLQQRRQQQQQVVRVAVSDLRRPGASSAAAGAADSQVPAAEGQLGAGNSRGSDTIAAAAAAAAAMEAASAAAPLLSGTAAADEPAAPAAAAAAVAGAAAEDSAADAEHAAARALAAEAPAADIAAGLPADAAAKPAPAAPSPEGPEGLAAEVPPQAAAAAAAAGPAEQPPPFVAAALQELQQPGFSPTQKQALQLLLPVQPYLPALPPQDVVAYVSCCFDNKVPLSATALLAAAQAAATADSTQGAAAPASLLLQLLSALADAVASASAGAVAGDGRIARSIQQQGPHLLQQLLPCLGPAQLAAASAAERLQLLRDAYTLSTGSKPPAKSVLPLGDTLFGTSAVSSSSMGPGGSRGAGTPQQLGEAWLGVVAGALEPKLLLLPHGSQLLQVLQLLQALGLQQPSGSFMGSFLAAADALLDTLSGRNCLELLAATAAAGQLPGRRLTAALLQHLVPLKLSATDVAAGCRLLAALGVRPSADLLMRWFDVTAAASEGLRPQQVLQVLWACCVWQVQPPSPWLHAVLRGLLPAGRLSSCSAATLAGLCRCLWQLGVQPAPGFVAAVVAAAEHSMAAQHPASNTSSSSWQQGGQQQQQQGAGMDVESLSVLCYCLFMWEHSGTPAWSCAVARQAARLLPVADGLSLLRLGVSLNADAGDASEDGHGQDGPLLPWQHALLQALPSVLPSADQAAGQEVVLTADGCAALRQVPPWALIVLWYVLTPLPEQSLPALRALAAAVSAAAEQEGLTCWDALSLQSVFLELVAVLQQAASEAAGPLAGVQVQQYQQEAMQVQEAAEALLKYAHRHRQGAPADVLGSIALLAEQMEIPMPAQSRANLQAAEEAAQQREQQLQQALLLQQQGGPAVPEDLLAGLAELAPGEPMEVVARYAASPLQAAMWRRLTWLGGDVGDDWILRGLSGV